MEAPAKANRASWMPKSVLASAGVIGVVGAASYLAYRFFVAPASSKKARSKHSKKGKKKSSSQEPVKAPVATKSGSSTPRTPPRSESPTANVKIVPDSSRLDQLSWWVEIARDQISANAPRHAKYYADKALALGENIPDFKDTLSYCQVLLISISVSQNRDTLLGEAKDTLLSKLAKMEATEGNKREFLDFKAKLLSSLSDLATKQHKWEDAEKYGMEAVELYEKTLVDHDEQRFVQLGISYFQLISAKRSLKKMEDALECAVKAYENLIKSKLKPDFSSAAARQRADILDILGRYDEAISVVRDHIERIEALRASSLEAAAANKDKTVDDENGDDDDEAAPGGAPAVSVHLIGDNLLFLARLMFQHSDYADSIAACQKAIALSPSPYYYSLLSSVQFEAGRMADALETQTQLKKIRPTGELPIATSKNLLTKSSHIRQPKLDGPWTVLMHLANQNIKIGDDALRLPAGTLLEMYVRRHLDAHEPVTGDATPMGPFIYIVKGDENNQTLIMKCLLPKALESNGVYEIIIHQYPSQDQRTAEQRIGTHRQMTRATAYSSISLHHLNGMPAPPGADDSSDDLDDYVLPEPRDDEDIESEAVLAHAPAPIIEDIDNDEIDADEQSVVIAVPETRQEAEAHGHTFHSAVEASEDAPAQAAPSNDAPSASDDTPASSEEGPSEDAQPSQIEDSAQIAPAPVTDIQTSPSDESADDNADEVKASADDETEVSVDADQVAVETAPADSADSEPAPISEEPSQEITTEESSEDDE